MCPWFYWRNQEYAYHDCLQAACCTCVWTPMQMQMLVVGGEGGKGRGRRMKGEVGDHKRWDNSRISIWIRYATKEKKNISSEEGVASFFEFSHDQAPTSSEKSEEGKKKEKIGQPRSSTDWFTTYQPPRRSWLGLHSSSRTADSELRSNTYPIFILLYVYIYAGAWMIE